MLRTTVRRLAIPVYAAFLRVFTKDAGMGKGNFKKVSRQAAASWKKLTPAQKATWAKKAAAMKPKRKVATKPRKTPKYAQFVKKNFKKFAHIKNLKARARAMAKAYRAEKK